MPKALCYICHADTFSLASAFMMIKMKVLIVGTADTIVVVELLGIP